MIDLSIITVTHQSKEYIPDLISSVIIGGVQTEFEHLIVDNASTDGTVELIRDHYGHCVRLFSSQRNLGFSAANNLALGEARGRYLLFLNPDMALTPFSLDQILTWMDGNPEVGVAGCKLVYTDGSSHKALQPRRFPKGRYFLGHFLKLFKVFPALKSSFYYEDFCVDLEQEVDHVRGAFMLVRREVVEKLGRSFDPRYFLLIEDMDFCREVKELGYKVIYTPQITCTDFYHRSFGHQSASWSSFCLSKSMLQYIWKWEPWYVALGLTALFPFALLIQVFEKE